MAEEHLSIAEKADYRTYIDGWRGIAILMVMAPAAGSGTSPPSA